MISLMKDIGMGREGEIPWCHHAIIHKGVYEPHIICPMNDPRVAVARANDDLVSEIEHSSVHEFSDYGYLRCGKCGWTP